MSYYILITYLLHSYYILITSQVYHRSYIVVRRSINQQKRREKCLVNYSMIILFSSNHTHPCFSKLTHYPYSVQMLQKQISMLPVELMEPVAT